MSRQERAERDVVVASLSAFVVTLAVHLARLAAGRVLIGFDHSRSELGFVCAIQDALARDDSLLVSALIGNGTPLLLAPEAQLFSLVRWLTLVFSSDVAATLHVVVHLALAAALATLLFVSFGVAARVAAACAIAFSFAGPVVDLAYHGMYVVGAVALPLAWTSVRAALRRGTLHAYLGVVLAVLLALLGGEPQAAAIACALVVFETCHVVVRRRGDVVARRRAAHVALTLAGAMLVGSWPWWGTLAELALTPRSGALAVDDALRWSLGTEKLVGLVVPGLTIDLHDDGATLFGALFPGVSRGWTAEPYLGAPLCALVLAALATRRVWRRVAPALVVALVGLVFSMGSATPIVPLLARLVPAVLTFRFPEKYLVVTTLAFFVLAAVGADAIRRGLASWKTALFTHTLVVLCLLASLAIPVRDAMVAAAVDEALLRGALVVAVAGALGSIVRTRGLAVVVLAIDLVTVALRVVPTGAPLADAPSLSPVVREATTSDLPVVCTTRDIQSARVVDDPSWRSGQARAFRARLVPDLETCDGLASGVPYSALAMRTHHLLQRALDEGYASAARALGCDVVVSERPFDADDATLVWPTSSSAPIAADDPALSRALNGVSVSALEDARPLVTVATQPELVVGEAALVTRLVAAETASAQSALVDDPLARLAEPALPDGARVTRAEASFSSSAEGELVLAGEGGAVVVVRRAFAVGWTATQAGVALPVVRAAGTSLAVVVDDVTRGPVELAYVVPRRTAASASAALGALVVVIALRLARRGARGGAARR